MQQTTQASWMDEKTIDEVQGLMRKIRETMPNVTGWCTPERACEYARLILTRNLDVSVVLGVWGGRDVFACAMAHQFVDRGFCVGVDPWLASASVVGQQGANEEYWKNQAMHDQIYNGFVQQLEQLQLKNWVQVERAKSDDVIVPGNIGLLIVDANHGPNAIRDVERWAPNVARNGVVFCDDIGWDGGAVREAVKRLEAQGFKKIDEFDTGAFFARS